LNKFLKDLQEIAFDKTPNERADALYKKLKNSKKQCLMQIAQLRQNINNELTALE
jgi:hypothetical protein